MFIAVTCLTYVCGLSLVWLFDIASCFCDFVVAVTLWRLLVLLLVLSDSLVWVLGVRFVGY